MSTTLTLPGNPGSLELSLEGSESGPTSQHMEAVQELLENWPSLREALRRPLFAYYRYTETAATESGPPVETEHLVWEHVTLTSVHVPLGASNNRYVQLAGGCSWEEEHGLEIAIRNGRDIMYVGQFDGQGHAEPPIDECWNFALESNQTSAFENMSLTAEEFDAMALSSSAITPGPSEVLLPGKPWWKLW